MQKHLKGLNRVKLKATLEETQTILPLHLKIPTT